MWARGLAAGLLLTVACSDLFAPDRNVHPRLQELEFGWFTRLRHGGLLYVDGVPADLGFRLQSSQRVPIELTVSSGDRETAGLYRFYCPPRERPQGFLCFQFGIGMRDGFHASDLAGHVAALGGRFTLISVSGSFADVTLFDADALVGAARRALRWPGVATVDLWYSGCQDTSPPWCASLSRLTVPVPVDTGAAIPGDGIMQVRSGDTVTVSYRQPDGSALETRQSVP